MENKSSVQTLDRAFALLEHLAGAEGWTKIKDLSTLTGLHKSTVHRLLGALADLGYVRRDESMNSYRLTMKLYELAGMVASNLDVVGVAQPRLAQLRDNTGEAVHLVVREGCDIVYVHKEECRNNSIQMFSRIGMRRPMYCTAVGKCILATLPDDEVEAVWNASDIRQHTQHTIIDLNQLYAELSQIRQRGYAMDNEENELGVRCAAAAIWDYTGSCSAAFSVSAPLMRMDDVWLQSLIPELLETAEQISTELGYSRKENKG